MLPGGRQKNDDLYLSSRISLDFSNFSVRVFGVSVESFQ